MDNMLDGFQNNTDDNLNVAKIESVVGGELSGFGVSFDITHTSNTIDVSELIEVSSGTTWDVYSDSDCEVPIANKNITELSDGNNTYYILVSSSDKEVNTKYTLTVYKQYYVEITYVSEDAVYKTEDVLTHSILGEGPEITRTGYIFKGWKSKGYYVEEEKTFTATWQPITCAVSFNVNGGDSIHGTIEIATGDSIAESKAFPKPSHSDANMEFMGWYTAQVGGEKITDKNGNGLHIWNADGLSTSEKYWACDDVETTLYARWKDTSVQFGYQRVDSNNTLKSNGTHVLFGEWPQTIKADDIKITTIQDERGYYLGSDDCYYAKVIAAPNKSGYRFSNNETIHSGSIYFFKVELIKWRILISEEGNKALLLCENIIAHKSYNERSIEGVAANNYAASEIREWLNNEFLNMAFFEVSQSSFIETTTVNNSAASTVCNNKYVCEDTNDKIFLLSTSEALNDIYGFDSYYSFEGMTDFSLDDPARRIKSSDYSRATGVWMSTNTDDYGNSSWWLRSPYCSGNSSARFVGFRGSVHNYTYTSSADFGVVPALVINMA